MAHDIRIVCLLGSPRPHGNSDQLAAEFCRVAENAGATVETHALRDMTFQGYDSKGERTDDLTPVLHSIEKAEIVVMATPIYFCDMTGLLKQAFDRFFEFFVPDYVTAQEPSRLGRSKALVLLQVQGEGPGRYGNLLGHYGPALDKLGFMRREMVRACGVREPDDIRQQTDCLEEAGQLARSMVENREGWSDAT
ncbi:MAG: NAD(P)H-dependent oxidoreductase [Roseovarius sp.]|nr:NAD(P)H-dependent oxidoreductase [Roseovarius sp.]